MALTRYPRPCPIPGHPQDEAPAESLVSDSAWSRLRAWHLHAPAERLPLPLALITWPAAWVLHAVHVPGRVVTYIAAGAVLVAWLTWRRHEKNAAAAAAENSPPLNPRLGAAEAATVTAAAGGWFAAAVTSGPTGWPGHLLSWIYVAGAIGGYIWLRRHEAVRAARKRRDDEAAWAARKAWWHQVAHRLRLDGWHLVKANRTLLGDELFIRTSPDGRLASEVIHEAGHIAERLAHILGLPYGRINVEQTGQPGELRISIRSDDPWKGPIWHPLLVKDSPYAALMPVPATITRPLAIGVDPETGQPLTVKLWDKRGAKVVQVLAKKDGGKTTLLDTLTERITACPDARLLQINLSKALEDGWWSRLAEANALDGDMTRALLILQFAYDAIRERPRGGRSTRVHQPTPAEPLFVLKIDEIDAVARDENARRLLGLIASKCRSEGWALVTGGQRATVQWTGGSDVRANADIVVWGKFVRDAEKNHVAGAEANLPDMGEYGGGHPGVFGVCELPYNGSHQQGRTFYWGEDGDAVQLLAAARAADRPPYILEPALQPLAAAWAAITSAGPAESPEAPSADGLRDRLKRARELSSRRSAPAPMPVQAHRPVPGVPAGVLPVLMNLLAAPEGTTAGLAAQAIGMSKSSAKNYLAALRAAGLAEAAGAGRGSRWRLARPRATEDPAGQKYQTLTDLAAAAHDGMIPSLTEDQRELLEQVWEVVHRPDLRVIDGEGDAQ